MTRYDLAFNGFSRELFPERQGRVSNVLWLLCSTLVMGSTGNLGLVITWLFIWGFAQHYATETEGNEFLAFFIGFYLFYPAISTVFGDLQEQEVVLGVVLIIFLFRYRTSCFEALDVSRTLRFVFYGWILWGLIAYFPVAYTNVIDKLIFRKLLEESAGFTGFDRGSTVLKTAFPMIVSPIVLLIPILGLRKKSDFELFWRALINGTLILCVLSLIRNVYNIDFIPQQYLDIRSYGFRLTGFSMPDPNGFGRMLLLPVIFVTALAIRTPWRLRLNAWLTLALGLICVALTFSRTTYASLTLALAALFLFNMKKRGTLLLLILFGVVIISVLSFFDILSYFAPGADRSSLGNLEIRFLFFDYAIKIISASPLFGAWPGGYNNAMLNLGYSGLLSVTDATSVPSAHNMVFNVAVEWGIPMAFLLLVALVLSVVYGIRAIRLSGKSDQLTKGLAYGSTALSLGIFVHGITEVVSPSLVFFNLGLIFSLNRYLTSTEPEEADPRFTRQNKVGE
jgi:O-antigen ligase